MCALEVSSFHVTHVCFLHNGPGLASKVFVMSQSMLGGRPLEIRYSVFTENISTFSNERENSLILNIHPSTQWSSNIQLWHQEAKDIFKNTFNKVIVLPFCFDNHQSFDFPFAEGSSGRKHQQEWDPQQQMCGVQESRSPGSEAFCGGQALSQKLLQVRIQYKFIHTFL